MTHAKLLALECNYQEMYELCCTLILHTYVRCEDLYEQVLEVHSTHVTHMDESELWSRNGSDT